MAAFQAALANFNNQQENAPAASSSGSVSIRGSATGAPSARGLTSALRGAGITREQGMDVDGGSRGGRGGRGAGGRRGARSAGPLDQTGRHRPLNNADNKPYQKPPPPGSLASRMSGVGTSGNRGGRGGRGAPQSGRNPAGTPPYLQQLKNQGNKSERDHARSELNKKLNSDEMKNWIKNRMIADGVLDMSNLPEDAWLKDNGILPPGHSNAPQNAGTVFWRIIDDVIQKGAGITIHTLSLAGNNLDQLRQLEKLPNILPDIRALDLSGNPIKAFIELDNLRAPGEKKGKANAGAGSLKSLIELKLNDCLFRERTLQQSDGEQTYKHEILRRFPGLRILDGVSLERVIFPIERKPKVRLTDDQKAAFVAKPFTFPCDAQAGFGEGDVKDYAMQFCAKFFALFDTDRNSLIPGYAPNALASISANTLPSRSAHQVEVQKTRMNRPQPVSFEAWTTLPSRNFFRGATSIKQRMETLQSPADAERLLKWWNKAVPKTKHPLTDPTKWCFETWVLDGEGESTKLCLMVQGEFEEMPSGTYRSFSRTFILSPVPQGSPAQAAGWPAIILSDTMIVHSYMGAYAFDETHRSLAVHGVTIQPPVLPATEAPAAAGTSQDALIAQLTQRTGMNAQFSALCLGQNAWEFEAALKNFEEIRSTIPAEAFV